MKAAIYIAFFFSCTTCFAQTKPKPHTNKQYVLTMAEHNPEFPGGNNIIASYIASHIIYPQEAIDNNIQGRVLVRFVVDSTGKVTDPEIVKSVHPLLDTAAIDVVEKMPDWKPGENNGHKVHVYFVLPITFHLQDDSKKTVKRPAPHKPATSSKTVSK